MPSPIDVTKMPPPVTAAARTPAAPLGEQGPRSPPNAAPIADHADIRPLDLPAALQILLAEVRAAFELQAIALNKDPSETAGNAEAIGSAPQAVRAILQMFLGAMPDEHASVPESDAIPARAQEALQAGIDRGIAAVSVWRNVPPIVVEAAKEVRTQVFAALVGDPQNPAWLRPEWAGLAPRLERFWRRRRLARRHLTDPDESGRADEDTEQRN